MPTSGRPLPWLLAMSAGGAIALTGGKQGSRLDGRRGFGRGPRSAFGWRFGSPEGPYTRPSERGDARAMHPNPCEQALLEVIIKMFEVAGKEAGSSTGRQAYRVAHVLNSMGVTHPRTGKPWQAGGLSKMWETFQKRQQGYPEPREDAFGIIAEATA